MGCLENLIPVTLGLRLQEGWALGAEGLLTMSDPLPVELGLPCSVAQRLGGSQRAGWVRPTFHRWGNCSPEGIQSLSGQARTPIQSMTHSSTLLWGSPFLGLSFLFCDIVVGFQAPVLFLCRALGPEQPGPDEEGTGQGSCSGVQPEGRQQG